ncbi:MAG: FAD/NAD(P)-binding protein [Deltaproteobacteria bacterium]|nr:FAD/NAD(P)-binding protein [Deltaproteobacteria bacterium]
MACDNCSCSKVYNENIFMPKEAVIVRAEMATASEKHFTLKWADDSPNYFEPGQFVEASLYGFGEIPIGYASSPTRTKTFDLIIRAVGRVSNALHKLEKGDTMLLRGPLGKGFPLDKLRGHNILVVAGGIGLCPTRSLIQYIIDRRQEFKSFNLFYGARSPDDQLFLDDLASWRKAEDVNYHETVDRGSDNWKGNVGVITTLFQKTEIPNDTRVIICGPPIMYKFVLMEIDKIGIPHENVYVDLERRMKCGVGKCGHCQINDKYVCTDGPVFQYSQIEKLEEAF